MMFIHGNNLEQKEAHQTKYRDSDARQYLAEIRIMYNQWKAANETLIGPTSDVTVHDSEIIQQRVKLLNDYKEFLDQQVFLNKVKVKLIY